MAGSSSSSEAEVFDADAARRQGQAHNITTASVEEVLPVGETAPQRHASDRAMSAQHNVGPAGGIVEDDLSVEDDIVAGVTTTENPADVRMQVIAQYQGSFKGLGNSASGRYHVHLTVLMRACPFFWLLCASMPHESGQGLCEKEGCQTCAGIFFVLQEVRWPA